VVVTVVFFATVGSVQVQTLLATAAVPVVGVAGGLTAVSPAGSVSVTTTFVASTVVLRFCTPTVKVTVPPGATVVGTAVSVTARSADAAPTTNVSVDELFADVASSVAVEVEAVLAIELPAVADADKVAGTVTVTVCAFAMLGKRHAIVVVVGAGLQVVMPVGLVEATVTVPNVTFVGAVSFSVTLVAADGPLLSTVIV
jgi:hypothetical protein